MIIALLLIIELLALVLIFYFFTKGKSSDIIKLNLESEELKFQNSNLLKQLEEKNIYILELSNRMGKQDAELAFNQNIKEEKKVLEQKLDYINKELMKEKEKGLMQEKLKEELKNILDKTKSEITLQNREQFTIIKDALRQEATTNFEKIVEKDVKGTMLKLQENLSLQQERLMNMQKPIDFVTKILSSSKEAGTHGEQTIINRLDSMGLKNGIDYLTQVSGKSSTDERLIADVVIIIPNSGKKDLLIIDSKSSTKLGASTNEFIASIEASVNTFTKKDYKTAVERRLKEEFKNIEINQTHLFIYLPFDRMLARIAEEKEDLLRKIREKEVGILTPVILDFLLDTIKLYSAKLEMRESAEEIMADVKILIERTGKVLELVQDLGKSVSQTAKKYQDLKSSMKTRFVPAVNKMSKPLNIKPVFFDGINEEELKEIELNSESFK